MAVQNKVLYAFRGWIAFVAFMDLGTAGRSYIERRSFLSNNAEENIDGDFTISRMLGMYSVLKALALIHCTLYIHYRPRSFCVDRDYISNGHEVYQLGATIPSSSIYLHKHYTNGVVSMGYWSLVLTIILYITEAFYFHSTTLNFYVVFPCILNIITLLGLVYLPSKLKLWGTIPGTSGMERDVDDENMQILRQMGNFRRRKPGNPIKNKHV